MTTPTLNDFYALNDEEEFTADGQFKPILADNNCFAHHDIVSVGRLTWEVIQNIETLQLWAIEVEPYTSWAEENLQERFIRGPFKVIPQIKLIEVTEYFEAA